MYRKIGRDDLKHVVSIALESQGQHDWDNGWSVCADYTLRGNVIVPIYPLSYDNASTKWRRYKPLEETPDLFIRLARLHEADDFLDAALRFTHRYGLLGGSSFVETSDWQKMKISAISGEAERAWKILRMYEAVLNQDVSTVRAITSESRKNHDANESRSALEAALLTEIGEWGLEQYSLHEGLNRSLEMVYNTVRKHCRFQPYVPMEDLDNGLFNTDASTVRNVWRFKNLLGAAYLQMYWLMTSGGELSRCTHCGRIMSLSRPNPEGRKPRRDRKFCDDACRQAQHRNKRKASQS